MPSFRTSEDSGKSAYAAHLRKVKIPDLGFGEKSSNFDHFWSFLTFFRRSQVRFGPGGRRAGIAASQGCKWDVRKLGIYGVSWLAVADSLRTGSAVPLPPVAPG